MLDDLMCYIQVEADNARKEMSQPGNAGTFNAGKLAALRGVIEFITERYRVTVYEHDVEKTVVKLSELLVTFRDMIKVCILAMEWFSKFPFGNEMFQKMTADRLYDQLDNAVGKAKEVLHEQNL